MAKKRTKTSEVEPSGVLRAEDEASGVLLPEKHRRGLGDTPWERNEAPKRGRFWKMLGASLIAHAFLTPGPALLGLVAMLPLEMGEEEDFVEVELEALPVGASAPLPQEPEVPEPAEPEPEPEAKAPEPEPETEEPEPEEVPPPAEEEPEPDVEDAPPGPTQEFGDPVMLAGEAASVADSNAHVRMILYTDVIRNHSLGTKVSRLLRRTRQWRDFFGPSKVDPIRDVDVVLIAGPQLRNSGEVTAVVDHNMIQERIREAFDNLVAKQGKWIDQGKLIAEAHVDRADRIFSAAGEEIVIVAPLHLKKQVMSLRAEPFPKTAGDVALMVHIDTPRNAAKGFGFKEILAPMKWAKIDLRPAADGGAVLKVRVLDGSEKLALEHAILLETTIRAKTTVGVGSLKLSMIKSVEFHAKGSEIFGTIEMTEGQLETAADFIGGYIPPPIDEGDNLGPNKRNGEKGKEARDRKKRERRRKRRAKQLAEEKAKKENDPTKPSPETSKDSLGSPEASPAAPKETTPPPSPKTAAPSTAPSPPLSE